jgi:hypothetical protein
MYSHLPPLIMRFGRSFRGVRGRQEGQS